MIRDVEDDSKGDFVATKLSIKIPSSKNQIPRKVTRNKRQITNNRQMPITNNQARDKRQITKLLITIDSPEYVGEDEAIIINMSILAQASIQGNGSPSLLSRCWRFFVARLLRKT